MYLVHSINNLAGPIKTWVSLIKDRLFVSDPRDEQISFYLEKIERETNRLLDEAEQMRLEPEKKRVDLRSILEPMTSSVKYQYPEITIHLHSSENPLFVYAAPSHLSVAIWNVVFNSVEALTESGTGNLIDISIRSKSLESKNYAEIIIADDGPGIPIEIQGKIFDLGYSTKRSEGLTGYGLWRSKDIVKNLIDGDISFTSEVSKGTKFTILIPLVE
ncbi:MAG TPA: HAMP domain-containing sensor histidine kinase [Candidatus Hydrogenedentes bacterium]|nr:HAMP domain-containing sensor histidine kinase [Candidatus Hydrogenedentota bacterium]